MIESNVTDADILRAHEREQEKAVVEEEPATLSKLVMAAFKRAKRASEKQNVKTREIVADLRRQREGTDVVVEVRKSVSCGQKTLLEYCS
jgi:hypothetical protein